MPQTILFCCEHLFLSFNLISCGMYTAVLWWCRILPCLRGTVTVRRAVMNPATCRMMRRLKMTTPMLIHFAVNSTKTKTAMPNKPHTVVSCQELRCQSRQAIDSHGPALKFCRLLIITCQRAVTTSHDDAAYILEGFRNLFVPLSDILSCHLQ